MSFVKYLLRECERIKRESNKEEQAHIKDVVLRKCRKYQRLGYRANTIKSLREFYSALLKYENAGLSVAEVGLKANISKDAAQYRARVLARHKVIKFHKRRVRHGTRDVEIINHNFDFSTLVQMGSKNGN